MEKNYRLSRGKIRRDHTGIRYYNLLVKGISEIKLKSDGRHEGFWECICDCGNITIVRGAQLTSGKTKSCGCRRPNRLPPGEACFNELFHKYQYGAKRRGIIWGISKDDFRNIVERDCNYCGNKPKGIVKARHRNGDFIFNGIDRVDNSLGYTKDNTVPCCKHCNRIKSNLSKNDFLNMIKRIYEHTNKS